MKITTRILPTILALFTFLAFEANAQASSSQFNTRELLVLQALQTIHGGEFTYAATTGNGNYGTLAQLGSAQLIDASLASGYKHGYIFRVTIVPATQTVPAIFYVTATPRRYRIFGRYSFFLDISGVIRGADKGGRPANANDPILVNDFCSSGSIADNERCVVQSFRTLHGAEMTYSATTGNGSYAGLTELGRVGLISSYQAAGLIHGYSIAVVAYPQTSTTPAEFRIIAVPQTYGVTGIRSFYIGTSGVIYAADKNGRPADENDPPLDKYLLIILFGDGTACVL